MSQGKNHRMNGFL